MAAPKTEAELFARARLLAGQSLGTLARRLGRPIPESLLRAKGWVGQLLETALGAEAGSKSGPDFPELGVELKSLPIDARGAPLESTFLCTLGPSEMLRGQWASSRVRAKLSRVLWLPVEAQKGTHLAERRVGSPLLWSPSDAEEATLREDWEQFAALVAEGWLDSVTGHQGTALQVRPKAAHARARRFTVDPEGGESPALPRGFYLRARFTRALLAKHYLLPVVRRAADFQGSQGGD